MLYKHYTCHISEKYETKSTSFTPNTMKVPEAAMKAAQMSQLGG